MKRARTDVPTGCLISLHRTLIEPYIRYCNTTWGGCNTSLLDTLQTLQNRAARVIANIKYENTDHAKLLKDLNLIGLMCKNSLSSTQLPWCIRQKMIWHLPTWKKCLSRQVTSTHTAQGQLPLVVFIPLTGSLILEKLLFYIGVHMYGINCLLKSGGLSLLKTSFKKDFRYCK